MCVLHTSWDALIKFGRGFISLELKEVEKLYLNSEETFDLYCKAYRLKCNLLGLQTAKRRNPCQSMREAARFQRWLFSIRSCIAWFNTSFFLKILCILRLFHSNAQKLLAAASSSSEHRQQLTSIKVNDLSITYSIVCSLHPAFVCLCREALRCSFAHLLPSKIGNSCGVYEDIFSQIILMALRLICSPELRYLTSGFSNLSVLLSLFMRPAICRRVAL